MNLSKLFETQRVLDERIVKEKGLEGQDLLPMKILALQVELGELAQNWRGFKFWSEDREPREADINCHECNGKGYVLMDNEIAHEYDDCNCANPLLEEYVDCLHFILSIGLGLKMHHEEISIDSDYTRETVTGTFIELFRTITELEMIVDVGARDDLVETYEILLNLFIGLGEKFLEFNVYQIEQAYYAKNQINHERQATGY